MGIRVGGGESFGGMVGHAKTSGLEVLAWLSGEILQFDKSQSVVAVEGND